MLPVKNDFEIVLYQPDNSINIEALLENDTIWLTLDNLSDLYKRNKSTISRHINNIFSEGELKRELVVAFFATTTQHGAIGVSLKDLGKKMFAFTKLHFAKEDIVGKI